MLYPIMYYVLWNCIVTIIKVTKPSVYYWQIPKHIIIKIWNQQLNVQTQCTSAYSHLSFTDYKFFKQSYYATNFTCREYEELYSKSNHIIRYNYEYKIGTKMCKLYKCIHSLLLSFTYAFTPCSWALHMQPQFALELHKCIHNCPRALHMQPQFALELYIYATTIHSWLLYIHPQFAFELHICIHNLP